MCFTHKDAYAEQFPDYFPNGFKADSVFNMLKYDPALQAMKVLIQSFVLLRDKFPTAFLALVH